MDFIIAILCILVTGILIYIMYYSPYKIKNETILEKRNLIEKEKLKREEEAKTRMRHYLSSPFTKECVTNIKEAIKEYKIPLNEVKIFVTSTDIEILKPCSVKYSLGEKTFYQIIDFQKCGYKALSFEVNIDAFALAICSMLGSEFYVDYYIPTEEQRVDYGDYNKTYIVNKNSTPLAELKEI